jgi:hypothetical protein
MPAACSGSLLAISLASGVLSANSLQSKWQSKRHQQRNPFCSKEGCDTVTISLASGGLLANSLQSIQTKAGRTASAHRQVAKDSIAIACLLGGSISKQLAAHVSAQRPANAAAGYLFRFRFAVSKQPAVQKQQQGASLLLCL